MKRIFSGINICLMLLILSNGDLYAESPKSPPKKVIARSVRNDIPSNYEQIGNTDVYCRQSSHSIDVIGKFGDQYYSSTYSDGGYKLAIKVGSQSAVSVDCLYGTTTNGVNCSVSILEQGEFARVVYTVTNTNNRDTIVSLGTHADVMIGNNDRAPIVRRIDTLENTYGLTMKDGNGAELCVLFGSGLVGVTSVSDFWFGYYSLNNSAHAMVGNYSSGANYMQENGGYDSGMGWCWKDRTIPANSSVEFSYLIGVGDVNLEPNSSFEVTPDDPEGWNDLSRPHRLTLNGIYESPAGIDGFIEYSVEDSDTWNALTDTLASGEEFTASLIATFLPERESHTINFRTVDAVGNTTRLSPIIYKDVYYHEIFGIESKTYNYGDSIYQTNLECDLTDSQYVINDYQNNINAGSATFSVQGVFPMTIGRRTYTFEILPLPLEGDIEMLTSTMAYTGAPQYPDWRFTSEWNNSLTPDTDYTATYNNNTLPGFGSIVIEGKGNYTGSISSDFFIDKAQLSDDHYDLVLPEVDINYDGNSHPAYVNISDGVGTATITYLCSEDGTISENAPSSVGSYDVYVEFDEGTLYYGKPNEKVGSFTIFQFDENEWLALSELNGQLQECGWNTSWNISEGPVGISHFDGLTIEQGHIVGVDFSHKNLNAIPAGLMAFSNLKSIDLSHNNLSGNIGVLASQISGLTTLDVSYNNFSDVIPMISSNVTTLDISHQTIDKTLDLDISDIDIEQLVSQLPTIILYDHANQRYNNDLNFICTTSEAEEFNNSDGEQFAMQLKYSNGQLSMPYVSLNNTYCGNSGDCLKVFALDNNDNSTGSNFHINFYFNQGDSNFSGTIDILDVQCIINYMFDEYVDRPFNFTAANLWTDEIINIQDAVCEVNLLLEQPALYMSWNMVKSRLASNSNEASQEDEASFILCEGKVILESDIPVAAFDITIESANEITINEELSQCGMMVSQKQTGETVRIIGYSLAGATLPVNGITICEGVSPLTKLNAMLADSDANKIQWTLESGISSVESISIDALYDSDIYNLDGFKVNIQDVVPGRIYIIISNGKTKKTVITK